ncbi:MAG: hypothetical protein IJX24_02070 [Oscillospiraceae bacterium]|nr:hypothetical protein [Oscillospiraceae bacterium]
MSVYENNFNECEAIPIKVNRVFDSCSDKDCIKGVQVALLDPLPASATIVKTRCITVSNVCINVEPIPFNKGFYSVDITFTFDVQLLVYETACAAPTEYTGTASVSKNCVLFGSDTNSRTFSSDGTVVGTTGECCNIINPPTALVQAVSPLVLESKIATFCTGCECGCNDCTTSRGVLLTIGLFYVVELTRPVTIMVPAYNYTIPKKECCSNSDTPCEVFDRIKFPVEEFSPAKLENSLCGCSVPIETRLTSDNCSCGNIEYD